MTGRIQSDLGILPKRMEEWLREINTILDMSNDYDTLLLNDIYRWWQQPNGPRCMFDPGFAERQS